MADERTIQEQCYGTCYEACNRLEAAQARIAALEAENAVMRRCLTDIRDNYDCDGEGAWHEKHCRCCKADGALSYKHAPTITPEGGSNGN